MKNKEKYAEDIIALAICGFNIACYKKTKELVACETLDCEKCMFNSDGNCTAFRRSWFESEVELTVEDELKSELETVKKERDELRARLERAVELPVKMGDWVYCVTDNRIIGGEVSEIHIEELDTTITFVRYDFDGEYIGDWCVSLENYNKTWFTTRVEAEGRLKELRGRER